MPVPVRSEKMSDDSYSLHRHFRVSYNANSVNLHGMRNMLRHRADRSKRQVVRSSRKIVFRLLILFPAEHFSQPGKDTVGSMIVDMIVIAVYNDTETVKKLFFCLIHTVILKPIGLVPSVVEKRLMADD